MVKKKWLEILNYVFFLSLAVVLMYFCFRSVNYKDLVASLKSVNYFWVVLSMIIGMVANISRAVRWRMMIRPLGYNPSNYHVYNALMIGYLVNYALPRAGEISRCAVLNKSDKIPVDSLLGTVIAERAVDMLCLLLSILLALILQANKFTIFFSEKVYPMLYDKFNGTILAKWWLWIVVLALTALIVLAVFIFKRRLQRFAAFVKLKNLVKGVLEGIWSISKIKNVWTFLFHTVGIWVCYWLTSYLIILAFPATQGLTGSDALFLMVVASLGWLAPVQGGFGSFHIMVALGLGLYGIAWEQGIIFATVSHGSQSIMTILFGFISFVSFSMLLKKRKKSVQQPSAGK